MFEYDSIHLLIRLFMAHIVSDYYLQFDGWAQEKSKLKAKSEKFWLHILFTFLSAFLFTFSLKMALAMALLHGLIDYSKMWLGQNKVRTLLIDQSLHMFSLVAILLISNGLGWTNSSFWIGFVRVEQLILLALILLFSYPFAMIQYILLYPLSGETNKTVEYLGMAERLLIVLSFATGLWPYVLPVILVKVLLGLESPKRKYLTIATFMSVVPTFLLCFASKYAIEAF